MQSVVANVCSLVAWPVRRPIRPKCLILRSIWPGGTVESAGADDALTAPPARGEMLEARRSNLFHCLGHNPAFLLSRARGRPGLNGV